jgi:phospholipid/cholesterol/gamma-HCH transport system substrate-binding protein
MPLDVHWKARLAFAAVLCASGFATWYFWSSGHRTVYEIETHDPVSGLTVGSPVEMHGVEIGSVTQIGLAGPRTVQILLSIDNNVPVSKATVATITSRGLAARGFTGYVYVNLEEMAAGSGALTVGTDRGHASIPTTPSQIETMDTTVAQATQQVRELTQLLHSLLDQTTIASIKQSVDGLGKVMALLSADDERLRSLIANSERDTREIGRLLDDQTISSLKQSLEGLQQVIATLTENDDRLASLITNTERSSRELSPLLNSSAATVKQLRTQLLPQLDRSTSDLDNLTHVLTRLANKVSRDPSTVIRGAATQPGPGEQ